ncbi:hypothetical protein PMZ80_007118 [Knufia obscura]|uniref:ATP-dependent Clp protease proteolytic subunit n=1 Tax=Knufia obscura TaxID=1635080 RepID=A0ABR0RJC2_9EURO|nr:hypothetical protein PMZ80_007118 [Knufia obscura]
MARSPGHRYVLPHATIMIHSPSGGYSGTSTDIQIHAKEILRIRDRLNGIYRNHLNDKKLVERRGRELSLEEIEKLMDRDYFMSAEEARDLGLVDEVLQSRKKPREDEEKK